MFPAEDQLRLQASDEVSADRKSLPWAAIAWFGILLIAAYYPILKHLVEQWSSDPDVGHGFFVPLVFGYIAWGRRERLMALEWKPEWWGLVLMAWGFLQAYVGMLGAEQFLQRSAFLISLVGLLLVLGGRGLVKELAFPLLLLPFMIPIPTVIYNQITFPLQLFASRVAETFLNWINIPVLRDGNVLTLASQTLSVAEACSGIRSLLSLSFLALVYAYFSDTKVWMRYALFLTVLPVAIIANAGRVTITGILSERNTELAQGVFHELEGFVIFAIAFAMIFVLHILINLVYRKFSKEASLV
jgi:exosortase